MENIEQKKLTIEHIKACIIKTEYQVFDTLTICVLTLKNGYKVIGKSACLDKSYFDAKIGEQVAFDKAIEKIWELEAYLVKQQTFEDSTK